MRVDRVEVHEALGEAVANALAHTNYYGRRGIVIIKKGKELTISNPGTIRITKQEFYAGGNSDPRNPNILKMFGFVNIGERAGSGIDKIITAWKEQGWKSPEFVFSVRSERITVKLEVGQVVYVPGAANLREKDDVSHIIRNVSKEEIILSYLEQYESISMGKATEICGYKTKSATRKVIDRMLGQGVIERKGTGPATKYFLTSHKEKC